MKAAFFVSFYLFFSAFVYGNTIPLSIERAKSSVVRIETHLGTGTGFFISEGLLVTNFHVIASEKGLVPLEEINIVQIGNQKENISAKIVGWQALSPLNDLALLKVDGYNGFTLSVEDSQLPDKEIYVLGFSKVSKDLQTIVGGDGVQNRDEVYEFFVNFSDPAGSSGSPLLNAHAKLIGIIFGGRDNFFKAEKVTHIKKLLEKSYNSKGQNDEFEYPNARGQRLYREEMEHIQDLARANHIKALYQLGKMYSYGVGVTRNKVTATQFFLRAAKQGHSEAQNDIGTLYLNNENYRSAMVWFKQLAEQNHPMAQLNLGRIYLFEGLKQYDREAMRVLKLAAVQGAVYAQYLVGFMYREGKGILRQDNKEAVYWLTQAAKRNYTPAQNKLGWMYYAGRQVEQNDMLAGMWLKRAALLGDSNAIELRKLILQEIGQDHTPRARRLMELLN